jgi:hypothetical protein
VWHHHGLQSQLQPYRVGPGHEEREFVDEFPALALAERRAVFDALDLRDDTNDIFPVIPL